MIIGDINNNRNQILSQNNRYFNSALEIVSKTNFANIDDGKFELEADDKRYIDFEKVILPRTKKYKYEHPCYDNKLGYYLKEETYSISEMRLLFIEVTEFKIIIGIETYIELSSFGSLYKFKL